jgi:uncharacterized membrane protein YfcA
MDELIFDILVAIGSFLAGVIGALIGLGGGVIITPLLVLAFGIDIRYAMGAALCSVIATSSGAAAAYLRDGISNMRIGLFLCVATTIGAVCGARLAVVLGQAALSIIFGAALLVTVLLSLRKRKDRSGADTSDPLAVKLRLPGRMPTPNGSFRTVHHVLPGFGVMWVAGVLRIARHWLRGIQSSCDGSNHADHLQGHKRDKQFHDWSYCGGERGRLSQARLS